MSINREKMALAAEVLASFETLDLGALKRDQTVLRAFANGREQGYHLSYQNDFLSGNPPRGVSFSENRNSDEIVAYFGFSFSDAGNLISEKEFETGRRFYKNNKARKVAEDILKFFETGKLPPKES